MSKPNVYDLEDETVLEYACAANIYDKLVATWRENHSDDLLRMFEENAPGDWGGAAEDLKDQCEQWVVKNAREAFAGGVEIPGYGDEGDADEYGEGRAA